jgi:hypothetical protein
MVDDERRLTGNPTRRSTATLDVMFSPTFLKDAAERAVATFAQTLVALVGTNAVDILSVGFADSLKAAAVAGGLSLVKSIAAARGPIGDSSASAVRLEG